MKIVRHCAILCLLAAFGAKAADRHWIAAGLQDSAAFSNPANWDGGYLPAPGDRLIFDDKSWGVFVNDLDYAFDSIAFQVPGIASVQYPDPLRTHEMRGAFTLTNQAALTIQGRVRFAHAVFLPPAAGVLVTGPDVTLRFDDAVLNGGTTIIRGTSTSVDTQIIVAARDASGSSSLVVDCLGGYGCAVHTTRMALGGSFALLSASVHYADDAQGAPRFGSGTAYLDTAQFFSSTPLSGASLQFPSSVSVSLASLAASVLQFDRDSQFVTSSNAGVVRGAGKIALGPQFFNSPCPNGLCGTHVPRVSSVTATGALQPAGIVVQSVGLKLEAPEALSPATVVEFARYFFYSDEGGDYTNDAYVDLGPYTQTVGGVDCQGTLYPPPPISGPFRVTTGRSLLRFANAVDVSNCLLSLGSPPELDASGLAEIPLVQMLGGATMTGMFRNLTRGRPVVVNGQTFFANYRRGASGQDLVLSRDFHRCAPSNDFGGQCDTGLVRTSAAGNSRIDGVFYPTEQKQFNDSIVVTHVGDFDSDQIADMLGTGPDQSILARMAAWGPGDWATLLPGGTGWSPRVLGDFNGDHTSDILWEHTDGSYAIWLMLGTRQAGGGRLFGPGTGWRAKFVADFNGDGQDDIAWTHPDGRVAIWLMRDGAQVGGGVVLPAGTGWFLVASGDFNGDGKADLLWQHADGTPAVWIMDGVTVTAGTRLFGAGTGWFARITGDFDGDGKADIVWQHSDGRVAVWFMDGVTQVGGGVYRNGPGPTPIAARTRQGRDMLVLESPDGSYERWILGRSGIIDTRTRPALAGFHIVTP